MSAKKKGANGIISRWQNFKHRRSPNNGAATETLHSGVSDKCLVVFDGVSLKLLSMLYFCMEDLASKTFFLPTWK